MAIEGALPKYLFVERQLRKSIQEGILQPGSLLAPERDLALTFKVSRICIRGAIDRLIEAGLLCRQEGGRTYVRDLPVPAANAAARAGGVRELRNAAIVTTVPFAAVVDNASSELSNSIAAIAARLDRLGANFTFVSLSGNRPRERWMEDLARFTGEGIIYYPGSGVADRELLELARGRQLPLVLLQAAVPAGDNLTHSVAVDERAGARLATDYLLQQGYAQVRMLTFDDDLPWLQERAAGYEDAMRAAGMPPQVLCACGYRMLDPVRLEPDLPEIFARLFPELRSGSSASSAPSASVPTSAAGKRGRGQGVTGSGWQPQAVFAVSDPLAMNLYHWARAQGVEIPQRLGLAGFDDLTAAGKAGLTTVSHMSKETGERAVELLERAVRDPLGPLVFREQIPPRLLVRASGCLRAN